MPPLEPSRLLEGVDANLLRWFIQRHRTNYMTWLISCPEVPASEKLLFRFLFGCIGASKRKSFSVPWLAGQLGLSDRQIQRHLAALEEKCLIDRSPQESAFGRKMFIAGYDADTPGFCYPLGFHGWMATHYGLYFEIDPARIERRRAAFWHPLPDDWRARLLEWQHIAQALHDSEMTITAWIDRDLTGGVTA